MRLRWKLSGFVPLILSAAIALGVSGTASATSYYVDGASSACSDSGAGTAQVPYCTISAAITKRGAPSVTILVKPAIYREDVRISKSGSSGSPLVVAASGSGVVVDGSDDFSSTAVWTLYSGNVWRADNVSWNPQQVFVDGSRLNRSSSSPASIGKNKYTWVSGEGLYVNVGGTSPGVHQTFVGRRTYGFQLSSVAWVILDGFTITRTEDHALHVTGTTSHSEITNNTISFANKQGISVWNASGMLVKSNVVSDCNDHGIYIAGCTASTIQENESFDNARPATRAANGIQLNGSSNNLVQRNRLHDNQDSGLQINSGSNNNTSLQNQSWDNGDHGFDHLASTGTFHIGDVAYRNYKDGFSIEGDAPNTTVVDCIAVDNGLTTGEYDLWIDSSSASGFVSDSNIFWNSTTGPVVKYVDVVYSSVQSYSDDSGHDRDSIQANPRFVSASHGNFRLLAGSPAIDSADSTVPNWPVTDADGRLRYDDATMPNTGIGPPSTFADRGAFEYAGSGASNRAPNGAIDTPTGDVQIAAGQNIRFTSTGTDPDGDPQLTFAWDFGGAAPAQSVKDPAPITFSTVGSYTISLTVKDSFGIADPTPDTRVVTVVPNQPPDGTIEAPAADSTVSLGQSVLFRATARDPEGHTPFGYLWNFGGGAPNQTVEDPGAVTFSTLGTYTVTFTVTDALGMQDPTPDRRVITVIPPNIPPNGTIQAPSASTASLTAGQSLSFTAGGSDPDGNSPLTYSWSFGGGAPNATVADPGPVVFGVPGTFTVTFTVRDSLGLADPSPDTRLVFVRPNTPPQGGITSPASDLTIPTGRSVTFAATGSDSDGHIPLTYEWSFGGGAPDQTTQNPGAIAFNDPGTFTVTMTVRDALGAADPIPETRVITVIGDSNHVGNPSFETDTTGWAAYGGATIRRASGGADGAYACEARGPSNLGDFGINDSPSWVPQTVAGAHYRVTALVRSVSGRGEAHLLVREYLGGVLAGPSATASSTLSPSWNALSIDYMAQRNGSTLDLQILDSPAAAGEAFLVDAVTIQVSPPTIAGSTGHDSGPPRLTKRARRPGHSRR